MAVETIQEKILEAESPLKEEVCVADSVKDMEKKEGPLSDDKEEEKDVKKGQVDDEEKTAKGNESPEKEPVTPVTERPSRIRKKVERYILPTPSRSSGSKPVSIEQGRGTQLKEIPNVAYKLSKRKPDDNLFLLHTILYGKKGKAQTLKRNIGQFSGFVWSEQEEEKQRAKAKEKLEKCIKDKLIDLCDVLDIPINKSNVKKEELTVSVLEFLVHPKATRDIVLADGEKETKKRKKSTPNNVTSGESLDVPPKETKKRKKSTPKNVTSGESSDVPAKSRRQTKKSGKKQDQPSETEEGNDEGKVGSEDDAAPEKENDKEEDTETEDEKDKAEEKKSIDKKSSSKRTKKEKPAPEEEKSLKGAAKSGRKSFKQVDKSTSSSSKKQNVDKEDYSKEEDKKQTSKTQAKGSKDQRKASKKGKREPTRKEMHVVVTKILKEVDFDTATLSDILRKLGRHFGVDLMHRKIEVKDIITDVISEMSDDDDDDERVENTEDESEKNEEDEERMGFICTRV